MRLILKKKPKRSNRFTDQVFYLKAELLSSLTPIAQGRYNLLASFDHDCVHKFSFNSHFLYFGGKVHFNFRIALTFRQISRHEDLSLV